MIKAIIFDLDGVILDSEPVHFEAHKMALEKFGIQLTLKDYMEFGVAKGDTNLYTKASQKYGIEIDMERITNLKKGFYRDLINERAILINGVIEALENLCEKYILAVASSGTRNAVDFVLHKLNVKRYFKFIVTGDDVENVKPKPDIYLKVISLIGFGKDEYVAIEDSESGLIAAKNAGIKCIVVPCEFTKKQDFSRADALLNSLSDFNPEIL